MHAYFAKTAVAFTALTKQSKLNLLALTASTLFFSLGIIGSASANLVGLIPDSALSKGGHKVTICHFPPGNPDNYQVITIDTNALNTHIDHHDDVFAHDGLCPLLKQPVKWQYLDGPDSWNATTGKPNTLENITNAIPGAVLESLSFTLKEGQANEDDSKQSIKETNVDLKEPAIVKIAYLNEGAGYDNAVAFFSFKTEDLSNLSRAELGALRKDLESKITEKVIFPNYSDNVLEFGDAVNLGQFEGNTSIGFTIIADGWRPDLGQVDDEQSDKNIFRTIKELNPEPAQNNLDAHAVLFVDREHELLVLGFEDLNRNNSSNNNWSITSDDDFNDVIIAIKVTPFSAIANVDSLPELKSMVTGVGGPASWRELNIPEMTVDPVKAAGQELMSKKYQ